MDHSTWYIFYQFYRDAQIITSTICTLFFSYNPNNTLRSSPVLLQNLRIGSICTRVRDEGGDTNRQKKTKDRILSMRGRVRVRVRARTPTHQKNKRENIEDEG
jgi:hypothetical protein